MALYLPYFSQWPYICLIFFLGHSINFKCLIFWQMALFFKVDTYFACQTISKTDSCYVHILYTSVADPFHFDTDPVPMITDPDPR